MTLAMLSGLPNANLTCIEISDLRIEQLSREVKANPLLSDRVPKFISCNLDSDFDLLSSDTFDVVVALDIMEHVLDVFGFISNCHRILKPGGVLYLRVPNIAYVKHRWKLLVGELPVTASWFGQVNDLSAWRERHGWDGGHLHLFTLPSLKQLLRESGFNIRCCADPGAKLASVRNHWPNLLFANPLIVSQGT